MRAALELVAAVAAHGREADQTAIAARAGVMTGEAAVTLGAQGQGMVAGDLVNTASRVQALAPPGTVLVGEATRRAAEAAIVFEDAGVARDEGQVRADAPVAGVRVVAPARGARSRRPGSSHRSSAATASSGW